MIGFVEYLVMTTEDVGTRGARWNSGSTCSNGVCNMILHFAEAM
jgi:hypothetical protein